MNGCLQGFDFGPFLGQAIPLSLQPLAFGDGSRLVRGLLAPAGVPVDQGQAAVQLAEEPKPDSLREEPLPGGSSIR
jgi:hypothetical protein